LTQSSLSAREENPPSILNIDLAGRLGYYFGLSQIGRIYEDNRLIRREYTMYKIFMLIAIPVLIIGWLAYWLWMRKITEEEKKQPQKNESQRLRKTKSEISDWAKQMANFKKPEIKRPPEENEQNKQE
jgi:Zn-dependent protease with chaperone function